MVQINLQSQIVFFWKRFRILLLKVKLENNLDCKAPEILVEFGVLIVQEDQTYKICGIVDA